MRRISGVMELVVGRTLQDPAGDSGERDPHVAVPQMPVGQEKHHGEDVAVQKGERTHAGTEGVGHDAEHDSGREPDPIHERDDLDRVLAQLGQGRHHLGGMVDLVELPERRDLVKGVVGGPIGEFVGQDLQHGRERENNPRWPEEGRVRSELARQPGDDQRRARRTGRSPACRRRRRTRSRSAPTGACRSATTDGGECAWGRSSGESPSR